jgi:hypothetical protein
MKFKIINEHPKDANDYTEASPNDEESDFVANLRALIASHPLPIVAKDIPIAWAAKVEDFAIKNNYEILMVRGFVNPLNEQLSTAFGTFYYRMNKSN